MNKKLITARELLAQERLFHPEIYPNMIKRNANEIIFLLWRNETLGDYITWSVFKITNTKYYVRRIIWKQNAPYKLKDPVTFAAEFLMPQEIAFISIKGFSSLHTDNLHCKESNLAIDGIEYGLKFGNTQISWQDKLPLELSNLNKWYEETVNQFQKLFF